MTRVEAIEAGLEAGTAGAGIEGPGPFERLVQIYCDNERHLAELRALSVRLGEARRYLERPDGNEALGRACVERLRAKYAGVLVQLRANRIEAGRILGWGGRRAEDRRRARRPVAITTSRA